MNRLRTIIMNKLAMRNVKRGDAETQRRGENSINFFPLRHRVSTSPRLIVLHDFWVLG